MLSSRPAARLLLIAVVISTSAAPAFAARYESGTFVDDDRSRYEPYIEAAEAAGLVSGCNPPDNTRFCPHRTVTRGEMAVMLVRSLALPQTGTDYFDDDNGHPAERAINALAEAGVTRGCGDGRFCPDRALTRGEMSSLVAGAMHWTLPANTHPYVDLDESPYGRATKSMARRGALDPCDPPQGRRLCPDRAVARDEAAFSLASALALGPAAPSPRQVDAPAIGFSDSFDLLDLWDGRSPSARNRVGITDSGYRGNGLRVTIPKGSHFGSDFKLDLSEVVGEEPEQLFFRYYLRLNPDWAPDRSGKLPGFSGVYGSSGKGGYESTPSSPGWSARMEFFGDREGEPRARIGYYVYHLGQEGRYGDGMMWNQAGRLTPGEWYCIEGEVALNHVGLADGALRAWVDGTPVFDEAGIEFRRPDEPEIKIESFWFNVYYGGKSVANRDLGMVFDEVAVDVDRIGCGMGDALSEPVEADITGDGFAERVAWGPCSGGTCFMAVDPARAKAELRLGDGAWFNLDTHRLGIDSGDFNGDGRADLVYYGRCHGSVLCWRVHPSEGKALSPPQNWGDGARFSPSTESIVVGDWNGDGFDDLAYRGVCGSDGAECWRIHRNEQGKFVAVDGGASPGGALAEPPVAADLNGDGLEDLLFARACAGLTCWFAQMSQGDSFTAMVNLGMALPHEIERKEMFDFDGDGDDDLITFAPGDSATEMVLRHTGPHGLADPVTMTSMVATGDMLSVRRRGSGRPVEAIVETTCSGDPCVRRLVSLGEQLMEPAVYDSIVATPRVNQVGRRDFPS